MAGISVRKYMTKDGLQKRYTITYRDIYGKQHTSGNYKTRAEAKKHLNDFENVTPETEGLTFEQIFKPYIDVELPEYSHTTQENYNLYINNHLSKLYDVKYDKVSSIDLQKFIKEIEKTHTPYVAQLCLKIGRAALNYAMKHKLIKENKFLAVNEVAVSPQDKHHLTEAQERELLETCKEIYPKYYALFYTLMGTGLRIGELLALEITDINFENRSIKVNKQFTKKKYKDGTKNTKKRIRVRERDVYITDDIIEVLQEHIKNLPVETKLLFPSQINGYINVDNLRRRAWTHLLAYVGIKERVRLHDLRGSYADIAFAKGATVKFVQNQLGHSKAQTTLDVYTQNNQDMIDNALENMNGILKSKKM